MGVRGAGGDADGALLGGESESGQCRYANGADAALKQEYPNATTVSCSDG